jgi:hypothetical protein
MLIIFAALFIIRGLYPKELFCRLKRFFSAVGL